MGVDLEQAANDVRDKVALAVEKLPQDIDTPPIVSKSDSDSDPIVFMQIQSQTKNMMELTDYAENVVQEQLQTCLLYTSPSPRDRTRSRMPSSA